MKSTIATLGLLALASAATTTETHITAAEWAVPTKNSDPYQCPMQNIPRYLTAGPSPSGALSSAFVSYEDELYVTCTPPATGIWEPCSVPPRSVLCSFSKAIPTSLLPAYSSYASSAASWWSAGNGDAVVSLVKECPYLWYDSLLMNPGSGSNLNRTVAYAQCWAEAHLTDSGMPAASTSTKANSRSGAAGSTATATPTPTSNGGVKSKVAATDAWMMAGSGMGMAAAMNIGLL